MKKNREMPSTTVLVSLLCSAGLLSACGGGSTTTTQSAPLVSIKGVVADGPLSGVVVCYDLNDNAACDANEPRSAPTIADGRYSFEVDPVVAGKHAVVAEIPATAVDSDTGVAVGQAAILVAPATGSSVDQSVFVSPLTTLVQAHINNTGSSATAAADFVKAQAVLLMSPLNDFSAGSDTASRQAASLARLALLTMLQQERAIAGVVGQTDLSGKVVSQQDLRNVVVHAVLGALPAMAAAVADPVIAAASTQTALTAAMNQSAQTIVTSHIGMTTATALAAIGVAKLPVDAGTTTPEPSASLQMLRFIDADNWTYRALLSTTADNTIDANGKGRYYDLRSLRSAGSTVEWGSGNSPERQGDLQWTGSAWTSCALGTRSLYTPRDANGRGSYEYCGRESGVSIRRGVDIAGATLRSVVETIRSAPGSSLGIAFSDWGPTDLALLGTAVFPAGAKLHYQSSTPLQTAPAYDVRSNSIVSAYGAAVTAGGDARNGGTPVCAAPIAAGSANALAPVANLEQMMERYTGQPCKFGPGSNASGHTGATNEWWSPAAVNLANVLNAATVPADTGSFYSTTAPLRVSFVPGANTANFYSCLQRAVDGSTRNCSLLAVGSFSIETVGDARVMRFSGLPLLASRLNFSPIFVEREGKVRYGYQSLVGVTSETPRLNMPAANALFAQLRIPLLAPVQ